MDASHDRSPKTTDFSAKTLKQARSTEPVSVILEAALQVLADVGAQRFTTTRVAEKAGVSVGSLYQYFPSKAILFRLRNDEWRLTTDLLCGILEDVRRPPLERVHPSPRLRPLESPRTPAEIEAYAEAMADMFCAYLRGLKHARKPEIAGKTTFRGWPTYEAVRLP